MGITFQRLSRPIAIIVLAIGVVFLITAFTQASALAGKTTDPSPPTSSLNQSLLTTAPIQPASLASSKLPPAPKEDLCLQCHVTGDDKGLWTPLARWVLFGTMGVIFAFGVYRSASVWKNRSPWKPVPKKIGAWVEERYQVSEPLAKFLGKPVPRYALHWWYCLGGITALLFVIQAITGILLAFYYKPTPEEAYASIQYIETQVYFGAAIRAIHHWAANGMIVMCIAHMLRVFIMGAYKRPRELNWVSGVLLLVLTLGFGLTGYLLPWDQRAFWATTVASEIAGSIPSIGELVLVFLRVGWEVTSLTLSRFYALHIMVMPIFTLAFMGVHFVMVRRQGIAKPL